MAISPRSSGRSSTISFHAFCVTLCCISIPLSARSSSTVATALSSLIFPSPPSGNSICFDKRSEKSIIRDVGALNVLAEALQDTFLLAADALDFDEGLEQVEKMLVFFQPILGQVVVQFVRFARHPEIHQAVDLIDERRHCSLWRLIVRV